MIPLLSALEEEKRKLNELGHRTFEQGIPLFKNKALQAQSKRVDELIIQVYNEAGWKRHSNEAQMSEEVNE